MGSGGRCTMLKASSAPSHRDWASTTCPTASFPLRPARPAICSSTDAPSGPIPLSPLLEREVTTAVRHGMFTPAASVSVANTTFSKLSAKSLSANFLKAGSCPAWWDATPARSSLSVAVSTAAPPPSASASDSCIRSNASTRALREAVSDGVRRSHASDVHCAASSHPARLKMNTIAGSILFLCRHRTKYGIDGTLGGLATAPWGGRRLSEGLKSSHPRPTG
mmetsp:Transcript_33380/g.83229  ORF Transcript_33380/g.83229 Transcript_33380/m.83229 type:complete len:222 (-) Transcript_33380:145-810(-)